MNKRAAIPLVFIILIVGIIVIFAFINNPKKDSLERESTDIKVVGGTNQIDVAVSTNQRYDSNVQPGCATSIYIKNQPVISNLKENKIYTVTKGDLITIFYCSNQTTNSTIPEPLSEGWYGIVERDIDTRRTPATIQAHADVCRWTSDYNATIIVFNSDNTRNPATQQAIGSGGEAKIHIKYKQPFGFCYSSPDGYLSIAANYNSSTWDKIEINNIIKNGKNIGLAIKGTDIPGNHQFRTSSDSVVTFKLPTSLDSNDELEFDVFLRARSGINPPDSTSTSADINFTIYDTNYYMHTENGQISGPATQNNNGIDLGISGDDTFGIAVS